MTEPHIRDVIDDPDRQPVHLPKKGQVVYLGQRETGRAVGADAIDDVEQGGDSFLRHPQAITATSSGHVKFCDAASVVAPGSNTL